MIPFYGYSLGPCLWRSQYAAVVLVCSSAGDENGCGCDILSSDFVIYLVVRTVCCGSSSVLKVDSKVCMLRVAQKFYSEPSICMYMDESLCS